jgi:hypothetical protein
MKPSKADTSLMEDLHKRRETVRILQDVLDHKLEKEMAEFIVSRREASHPVKKSQIGFHRDGE